MALSAGSIEIRLFAELARLQSDMKKANRVVEDAMGGIQKTVKATGAVFGNLAGAFGAVQIVRLMDDYKRFDSQLKLSTKNLNEYGQAYANVIRIGRTAQSDIGAIGVLYARLNNNLRDFNVTQKQVSAVTETISLALRVNNATVQETNSVMLQLSQSFGSGKLNGQEFLAVAEGAPMLLRQLATSLGVPLGALKDLATQGTVTRETLLKAWSDPAYLAALREQVKAVGTITSSITVLMNNLKQYIGEADKATGSSKLLAGAITFIADNINLLVTGAIAYGIISFVKWTQSVYASTVATKLHAAETIRSTMLSKVEAEQTAINTRNKIALDNLKVVGSERVAAAKVLEIKATINLTTAEIAAAKATVDAIRLDRLRVMHTLEMTRAQIAFVEGTIARTTSTRALIGLNYQLSQQEGLRTKLLTELASLGTIQASVNGKLATSNAVLLAQQYQLNAAQSLGGVALANNAAATTKAAYASGLLLDSQRKIVGTMGFVTGAVGVATTAWRGLNVAVSAFGGWIGLGVTALILFSDKILQLADRVRGITPELKELNDELEREARLKGIGISSSDPNAAGLEKQTKVIQLQMSLIKQRNQLYKDISNRNDVNAPLTPEHAAAIEKVSMAIAKNKDILASLALSNEAAGVSAKGMSAEYIALAKNLKTAEFLTAEYKHAQELVRAELVAGNITAETAGQQLLYLAEQYKKATGALKEETAAQKAVNEAREAAIKLAEANAKAREEVLSTALKYNDTLQKEVDEAAKALNISQLGVEAYNDLEHAKLLDAIAMSEQIVARGVLNGLEGDALKYAEAHIAILKERVKLQEAAGDIREGEAKFKREKQRMEELGKQATKNYDDAQKAFKDAEEAKQKEFDKSVDKYNDIFRTGFADMLNGGKSTWKSFAQSLVTTFKTTVADQIYKMLAQPFVVKIVASMLGLVGGSAVAVADVASGASSGFGTLGVIGGMKAGWDVFTKGLAGAGAAMDGFVQSAAGWVSEKGFSQLGSTIFHNSNLIAQSSAYLGAVISLAQGNVQGAVLQGAGATIGGLLSSWNPAAMVLGSMAGGILDSILGGFGGKDIKRYGTQVKGAFDGSSWDKTSQNKIYDRDIGAGDPLAKLSKEFSTSLAGFMNIFGDKTAFTTSAAMFQRGKSEKSGAGFTIEVDGEKVKLVNFQLKKASASTVFKKLVDDLYSEGFVKAVTESNLPREVRNVFKGLLDGVDKKQGAAIVQGMVVAISNLDNAADMLKTRFNLTMMDALKLADATKLTGQALVDFTNSLVTIGYNISEAIFSLKSPQAQFEDLQAKLVKDFAMFNLVVPKSSEGMIRLGESIDITTDAGMALAKAYPALVAEWQAMQNAVTQNLQNNIAIAEAAVQASQQALDNAAQAVTQAYEAEVTRLQGLIKNVETAEAELKKAFDAKSLGIQATIDKFKAFGDSIRAFRKSLEFEMGSKSGSLAFARTNFANTASSALSGNEDALGNIQEASTQYLSVAEANATDFVEYARVFGEVSSTLLNVENSTYATASVAEQQLTALEAQVSSLITLNATELTIESATQQLLSAQLLAGNAQTQLINVQSQQTAWLQTINGSVLSVAAAMSAYTAAQAQLSANQAALVVAQEAAKPKVTSLATLSDRDVLTLRNSLGIASVGRNLASQVADAKTKIVATDKTYSFAVGTDYVPHDMSANIHQGERIVPAAYNRSDATNAEILVELKAFNARLANVEAAQVATALHTSKSTKVLERMLAPEGDAINTRVPA